MSSAHNPSHAGHSQRAQLSIPQFEPLPPTSFMNRLMNKVLAPIFYLLFTIVTAIIVVPVYTVIEEFKKGRNSKGGRRAHRHEEPDEPETTNKAKDFLSQYSSSYGGHKGSHRKVTVPQ